MNNSFEGAPLPASFDLSNLALNAAEELLESPSEIISEEAIKQTLTALSNDNNIFDTGIGPGRIRRFADQDPDSESWRMHERHFFILSSAGKPIYSRFGSEDKLSSLMGVIQAIVSVYQDLDDLPRCINAGCFKMVFLIRGPLYFVVVSQSRQPESAVCFLLELYFYVTGCVSSVMNSCGCIIK